jgi:putative SOS response-associated peptidase YedK
MGSAADAKAVLKPHPQECIVAYQVITRVNAPKNNNAALIEPVDNPISDDHR